MGLTHNLLAPFATETAALAENLAHSVVWVHGGHGHGAGVIWQSDGLIMTNDHVVARDRVTVELEEGRRLAATVIARNPDYDLAALHVAESNLPAAPIGDAKVLRVGELIMAVGHPFGVKSTATLGIVSAVGGATWLGSGRNSGRRFAASATPKREWLQADVALAPGNSGGPLADTSGRVVGIASMILSPGIALAVPSHIVSRFVAALPRVQKLAA
ncbi:MAG: trypsin-like peptidase domain-containing protein [Abitibacteriaceae bacterium]|nr:trypsin-like peptidase domain-containing protein [Abditibacteriaceae bacterium]